jgi:protein-S-isoprenylcysteine O-methyltransferase Ste14
VSEDRLIQILVYLTILLFISAGIMPMVRRRNPWAKWVRWGAVMMFAIAFVFAVILVLRWAFDRRY